MRTAVVVSAAIACAVVLSGPVTAVITEEEALAAVWIFDNLTSVGGHPVTVVGSPAIVKTPIGPAVEFNGVTDGLYLEVNPLKGLRQFTIEALIEPAAAGPEEQRFLHIQETGSESRALLELRLAPDASWCLDTFLRQGATGLTLIDRAARHQAASWHAVALTYDGTVMTHFVDGRRELEGAIVFGPLGEGRTSIGMRQNQVSWFKGRIRAIRVTPAALPADRLMLVPRMP